MEEVFKWLGETIKTHGVVYVGLLVVFGLLAFWAYTAIKKWGATPPVVESTHPCPCNHPSHEHAEAPEEEEDEYAASTKDLTKHLLFAYLRHAVKVKIPHLPIEDPMRRECFRDLLKVKCEVFRINLLLFLDQHEDLEELHSEFHSMVLNLVTDSVNEYEQKALDLGIPKEAVNSFSRWHERAVNMVYDLITSTGHNRFYGSNTAKMIAILDWILAAFQITLVDAQNAMDSLNGELNGKTYKGYTGHCKNGDHCETCTHPSFMHA